eukprot:TRINITY_DN67420_c6_g2_i1.p2 TRINITY_DN67420_c6_g2~~TRINITY_DN67420_c6_g2_i1.p2  ORF type:complete len:138 (+),score=64.65 TRINITY_DN67420_c6_g2_i1:96-509(+)
MYYQYMEQAGAASGGRRTQIIHRYRGHGVMSKDEVKAAKEENDVQSASAAGGENSKLTGLRGQVSSYKTQITMFNNAKEMARKAIMGGIKPEMPEAVKEQMMKSIEQTSKTYDDQIKLAESKLREAQEEIARLTKSN